MKYGKRLPFWAVAVIPYLLVSATEQSGLVTRVNPDGSGERAVYARAAAGRADEVTKYLRQVMPTAEVTDRTFEAGGKRVLVWRDRQTANAATLGEVEITAAGIVHEPLSVYTKHTWKETLTFDRGDATTVEVHGQGLAGMTYVLRMPGKVISHSPPGKVEGNRIEWDVKVGTDPQTFSAESQSVRWAYAGLWLWVALFVLATLTIYVPRIAKKIPRKPRKI